MYYKLVVYVPDSHLNAVKQAIFEAGAGGIGRYDQCCWQVQGEGQFRPLAGANPTLGDVGRLHRVTEWRVETIVPEGQVSAVVAALKLAHPYEEPAFDLFQRLEI